MQPSESGTRKDLVFHRIETAKEDLKSAKILREAHSYKGANNRAYYAVFHAICTIHALTGVAYKRHKDAIGKTNRLLQQKSLLKWQNNTAVNNCE